MLIFRLHYGEKHGEGVLAWQSLYTLVATVTFRLCCIDTSMDLPPKFSGSLFALTGIAMETQGSGITGKLRGRLEEAASPPDCEGLV